MSDNCYPMRCVHAWGHVRRVVDSGPRRILGMFAPRLSHAEVDAVAKTGPCRAMNSVTLWPRQYFELSP